MSLKKIYPAKGPTERLSYGFNWSPRNIGNEVITNVTATVEQGSCVVEQSLVGEVPGAKTGQGTVHIISGGGAGELCKIFLQATTGSGSILDQTVFLPIRNK